ncbi:autotransporter assembly complex protein TamA [Sneathiella marina]|uniref:Autotransporter assembly complex protein TamA n=1 Tax=Sneathiella marina TaxID=2950108 RepID=A0ABY4W6K8_9PROT|nr:autotransporter assembly complex family protein [Sneathiella marina]USG62632.1 autotransporter assembly complex protein TamA [Sneathiella marina]
MSSRLTYVPTMLLIFLLATFPLLPALAATDNTSDNPAPDEIRTNFDYDVTIDGAPSEEIEELILKSSRLEQLEDHSLPSLAAVRRRADEDKDGMDKVLRSEGYYDNKVTYEIDETSETLDIKFSITSGARFRVTKFDVIYEKAASTPETIDLDDLGIEIGMPARSAAILNAQRNALTTLANRGFPDAKLLDQEVIVDFATDGMEVTLSIDAGPRLKMGALKLEGLKTVEEQYLRKISEWQAGVLYDASIINALRRRYLRTGLFANVQLEPRTGDVEGATVPVVMKFAERDQRTIGIGGSASTSEGLGTQAYWEHRNFFGEGEKVRVDLEVAEIRRGLRLSYTKPNYRKIDQDLKADIEYKHENTEAYKEDSIATYVGLERIWREKWVVGIGITLEYANIEDDESQEDFALAGLPMTARYDTTDDILDPTTGYRIGTAIIPYLGLNDISPDFLRGELDGSAYYPVLKDKRLVLAARGKIGAMAGESANDIPATKRFYAGGGGSIRGYKYQTVGPLNSKNDPIGGRSLLEVGFEARIRITEDIGLVPFIEGGNVYESMVPDFSDEFLWGAGLGLRYYTAVGPIRFDVAMPLDRRKNVDDPFQFYISIGQAF